MAVQQTVSQGMAAPQGVGEAVLVLQSGLAAKAVLRKGHRFKRLYPLIWRREWLGKALDAILDNSGSETPGVDGKRGSLLRDPDMRAKFLDELQKKLRQRYRPSPVLRKYIPKASGEQRPIGIPTIKDRVVQMALKMLLEPIYEADFLPNSNGFRPQRSTLECVLPIYKYGNRTTRYDWILEGDIKGCFDNIDHKILMKAIQRRIADTRILQLIWRFLKAPVIERGKRTKMTTGIPQGGALSPTLANIYLHKFDQYWFAKWGQQNRSTRRTLRRKGQSSCVLFRYADDFILCIKGTWNGAVNIRDDIIAYFSEQLKLNLTASKTRVVLLEKGFDFLGFHIQRQRLGRFRRVLIRPTYRNVARLVVKLQKMLGQTANADDPVTKIKAINRVLIGWANYYKAVNARKQFEFGDYVAKRLFQTWYQRRHSLSVQESFKQTRNRSQTFFTRSRQTTVLYQMTSLRSQHTSMNHKACWKYRSIRNPYLQDSYETCLEDEPQPLVDTREAHPIQKQYDETYLINRIRTFDRDGWKCTQCSERLNLVAHHIEPVPVGKVLDPEVVHRVENLETLCATCHHKKHLRHSA